MAQTPERVGALYATVRAVARFCVWFFFKAVEVRHQHRVPSRGPVLLCANHPNNLIDSLLLSVVVPRKVHYLGSATLFRNPILARFLRACGVIPVYRKQDNPGQTDRNTETFTASWSALNHGRVLAIYPEGTTHAEPRVQRIKKGAARIALGYEAQYPNSPPLTLIPVGLSFEARKSFRSRVLIDFGPPIAVAPHLERHGDAPAKAVEALTTAIQRGIEAQVVQAGRVEATDLIRAVETLYREDLVRELRTQGGLASAQVESLGLSRAIEEAVVHFKARDPQRVERIWQRIRAYRTLLAKYRVQDRAVEARMHRVRPRRRLRSSGVAVLAFPLFAYGAATNALPYLLPRWLAQRQARKETDYATVRLLASVVAFPVFWGIEIWAAWRLGSVRHAALFALSLPVSGLVAYHYLAGLERLRSQLRLGILALARRRAASSLLAEREAITSELERAKNDYLAATRSSEP